MSAVTDRELVPTIISVLRKVNSDLSAYASAGTDDQCYLLAVTGHVDENQAEVSAKLRIVEAF